MRELIERLELFSEGYGVEKGDVEAYQKVAPALAKAAAAKHGLKIKSGPKKSTERQRAVSMEWTCDDDSFIRVILRRDYPAYQAQIVIGSYEDGGPIQSTTDVYSKDVSGNLIDKLKLKDMKKDKG